jgi:hypothetical protein
MMALGVIYFVVMAAARFGFRVAPLGWRPLGLDARRTDLANAMITRRHVHLNRVEDAAVLADLGCAVPQRHSRHRGDRDGQPDVAGGVRRKAVGSGRCTRCSRRAEGRDRRRGRGAGRPDQPVQQPGPHLLGVAVGRKIGRKNTYYTCSSSAGHRRSTACCRPGAIWACRSLFVASVCVILSMYGGGFATLPAYLADIFGTQMVGCHPRPPDHRLVGRRRRRSGPDRRVCASSARSRRAQESWSTTSRSTSWRSCCSAACCATSWSDRCGGRDSVSDRPLYRTVKGRCFVLARSAAVGC